MKIYKDIAPYYNRLMDDVNYKQWIGYIKDIFTINGIEPEIILDLGCGTGIPASYFLKEGYRIIGIDGSMEMLRIAKEKLSQYNPVLIQSRFEYFTIKNHVDLVISLFDSLNNLIYEKDLLQTFINVGNSLRKGGLFIFDMNTIFGLSHMNSSSMFTKETKGIYSIWKSKFDKRESLVTLFITLFVSENGYYKRVDETHIEKGYSLHKLKMLLRKSGFSKISFFEHLTFRRPNSRTQRVMISARKD
ncbi:class I SAM-dependent methyltransferase [candidate division WOR-3 bacterium]|nr:class I SAM-dependent methyltransferase [candidate division WOR-3 bacterium]MCK4575604.1 class I SAM-dependent methyltransferase [candidate division WOR-3 bacterium]